MSLNKYYRIMKKKTFCIVLICNIDSDENLRKRRRGAFPQNNLVGDT